MAVVIVRPNATASGASNYTITGGSANVHSALSDNADATYIRKTNGTGTSSVVLDFGTTSIGAAQTIRQVRLRARIQTPSSSGKLNLQLGTKVAGVNYFTSALAVRGAVATGEVTGQWYSSAPDGGPWTQTKIDNLRLQVTDYRDSTDRAYIYELYIDVDVANQATVTVSAPTGTLTTTAKPDVSWTVTDPDGDVQSYYQVKIFNAATYSASGFDPSTSSATWDSSQILGTDVSTTVGDYLPNATYRCYVRTAKTINGFAFWSGWAYSAFTISLSPPTIPTLSLAYNSTENKVTITATGAAPTGFSSQTFELQRTSNAGVSWSTVRYAGALIPNGSYVATVVDNEPPRGATVGYRVRSIGASGVNVQASAWSSTSNISTVNDGSWIIKTIQPTASVATGVQVIGPDSWDQPEQIGIFNPLGRVYPVVVASALQGTGGSYRIITTTTAQQTALETIVVYQGTVLVLSPYGDQKYIRIVGRRRTRSGTPTTPRYEYELDYVEVQG